MSDIENKIAPYMNNYGQKIIDQNLDFSKIDKIFEIMSEYKKAKELSGFGVFINALFDACVTKDGK